MGDASSLGPCPLCGRASELLHTVCHRMIHRVFNEKELATTCAGAVPERQ